jgi:hypothetical protein
VIPAALIIGVLISLYLSYLFNLVAGNVYMSDYDEERFLNSTGGSKRAFLSYLLKNPVRLAVTATVTETLSLAASSARLFALGF